ncbi:MAG TPA: SDR family NAD(P)-dependent oxidoreductase [Polyangiaceae bacterium]|nr:SDR family NAD(P)-dependent oxidoreductase [Polyangiaceae bacterium]
MDLELEGRVALVTGGGRNVGRAVCLRLAREGARVIVNDFYADRADAVAKEIAAAGGTAVGVQADVTQEGQVRAMVDRAERDLGPVDVLVNNAGIPASGSGGGEPTKPGAGRRAHWVAFHESSSDLWRKTIELNVYGTMFCTHAVLPSMVERRSGRIVSVISEAGRIGEAKLAAYSGAKASIFGFSKALAREVGRFAVNVNVVALGAVDPDETPYAERPDDRRAFLDKILRAYPIGQGLQRLSHPEDAADAIAFLASERARYITGQCLGLSGGFAMP